MERWLSPQQAADIVGCCRSRIHALIRQERLRCNRLSKRYVLIASTDLLALKRELDGHPRSGSQRGRRGG
jgi:hypothetical protein